MKKYILPILLVFVLIIGGIALNFSNLFNNKKNNTIYLDNFTITKLFEESSNKKVNFKSIYPNGSEIHEYEFSQKDVENFKNSQGIYLIEGNQTHKLNSINTKHSLNNVLKDELLKLDDKTIDNIHYPLSLKTTKDIYNKLVKTLSSYVDQNKVKQINAKFDNAIANVSKYTCNQKLVSVHNAWHYFNRETKANVFGLGDHEGNLISNKTTNDVINNLKENDKLLSEKFEELTPNESKLMQKYKLNNVKVDTFERELKNSDEYFKYVQENYKNICG